MRRIILGIAIFVPLLAIGQSKEPELARAKATENQPVQQNEPQLLRTGSDKVKTEKSAQAAKAPVLQRAARRED